MIIHCRTLGRVSADWDIWLCTVYSKRVFINVNFYRCHHDIQVMKEISFFSEEIFVDKTFGDEML